MVDRETGVYIGVDLGGTNVRAGAITPDGDLLAWQETPTEAAQGPEKGLGRIESLIQAVANNAGQPLLGIGIGSTGPLDRERGRIQNPYTLPGWEDVDIVTPLRERFGVPVALENDADAAALGEAWMGAGKGAPRMVMVTIGSGVGFAAILDGKIYRGLHGAHPEGGHLILDPSGPECYCGARGCMEMLVSGPAIARYAQESAGLRSSAMYDMVAGRIEEIDAGKVFAAARMGDPLAQEIVARTGEYTGMGLMTMMMLFLPDCIVLTGGILRSYDLLEEKIRSVIIRHNVIIPAEAVQLKLAELGQHSGVYGASRAAQMNCS